MCIGGLVSQCPQRQQKSAPHWPAALAQVSPPAPDSPTRSAACRPLAQAQQFRQGAQAGEVKEVGAVVADVEDRTCSVRETPHGAGSTGLHGLKVIGFGERLYRSFPSRQARRPGEIKTAGGGEAARAVKLGFCDRAVFHKQRTGLPAADQQHPCAGIGYARTLQSGRRRHGKLEEIARRQVDPAGEREQPSGSSRASN